MPQIRSPRKSADDRVTDIIGLAEKVAEAARDEVRHYLSVALKDLTKPAGTNGRDGDINNLVAILEGQGRHSDEIDDSFLAGIRLAAQLVGDSDFDY